MMSHRSGLTPVEVTMAEQHQLTSAGMAVGTVAYMSPEHARGEAIDQRSDLCSLGVVMYEMATGVQTFKGQTTAVIFDQILNRVPVPPSAINPDVIPSLEHIIGRLLVDVEPDGQGLGPDEVGVRPHRGHHLGATAQLQVDPVADVQSRLAPGLLHRPDHVAGQPLGRELGGDRRVQDDEPAGRQHGHRALVGRIGVGETSRFATPAITGRDVVVGTQSGVAFVRTS